MRAAREVASAFLPLQDAYSRLFVRSLHDAARLADAWPTLSALLEERARKAVVYSSKLDGGPWRLLNGWRSSGVCWRYSLLADSPEQTPALTEAVRQDGFYVSNLYWPVNQLFNPVDCCPNAEDFARRIVNLWVDHTVDSEWIERCVESLRVHAVRKRPEP
jgi:dTDP-4-amino-4,6-dideoxygalactose transaminase